MTQQAATPAIAPAVGVSEVSSGVTDGKDEKWLCLHQSPPCKTLVSTTIVVI